MSFGYQVLGFGAFPSRGPGAYVPTHAAVFDGSADYLTYRPSAAAKDRTRYTISFWMKRNTPYDTAAVLICNNKNTSGNDFEQLKLNNHDLEYQFAVSNSTKGDRKTYNNFRDPTGWVHIMFVRDVTTTKIYVNGSEANYAATTDPGAGDLGYFTSNEYFVEIGRGNFGGGSIGNYYHGMLAEFIVLDGVAATIGSFGETNSTGEWVPKNPLAGYGTDTQEKNISDWGGQNSVYFNFSDSLNLGKNFRPLDVTVNDGSYKIDYSLYFEDGDDLHKTTASSSTSSNTKRHVIATWIKDSGRTQSGAILISAGSPSFDRIEYVNAATGNHYFQYTIDGGSSNKVVTFPNNYLRDPTAWRHLVVSYDTTAGSGQRIIAFMNGVEMSQGTTGGGEPAADATSDLLNNAVQIEILSDISGASSNPRGIKIADFIALDGQSIQNGDVAITNFGGWDANGVWMPKDPTAQSFNFGNNGFLLQFKGDGSTFDSNADAGGVGADTSGEGHHLASSGDVHLNRTTDTPTDTSGDNEGNFATWNPAANRGDVTVSEGNFVMTAPNPNPNNFIYATHVMRTGKWYMEFGLIRNSDFNDSGVYLVEQTFDFGSEGPHTTASNNQWGITLESNTQLDLRHNNARSAGGSITIPAFDYANDRLLMAFDADNKKVHFGYYDASASNSKWLENDGTVETTDNPPTASPSFASTGVTSGDELTGDGWYLVGHLNDNNDTANKMRMYSIPSTWSGTAPSGYKALSTFNYTAPTYTDARKYFATLLYTGTGSSRYVRGCYDSSGTAWTPDWVWIKGRTDGSDHALYDCLRHNGTRALRSSNSGTAEDTDSTGCQGFFSGGIELGDSSGGSNAVNRFTASGYTYVAWCWKAGGKPTVVNNNTSGAMDDGSVFKGGTVQSSYTPSGSPSVYPTQMSIADHGGFSIVGWTGDGTNSDTTIPHGLDAAVEFIITRNRDNTTDWLCKHKDDGLSDGTNLRLNQPTNNTPSNSGYIKAAGLTTHTFEFDEGDANANNFRFSNHKYIAYCFKRTPGLIGIGHYIGAGSDAEPYVIIDDGASGFRPAWLMIKRAAASENWYITDAARSPGNLNQTHLLADSANTESSGSGTDFTANGFKVKATSNSVNAQDERLIYLAFSDQAFSLQARAR